MKFRNSSRKSLLSRILVLTLALMMALSSTAFAYGQTDAQKGKNDPPPYTIDLYGNVYLTAFDTIREDWGTDGCKMDTCFLTSDSLLRRLRLTFNAPYDLYDTCKRLNADTTVDVILNTEFSQFGQLRDYLSRSTIRDYRNADGLEMLYDLQTSRDYRYNRTVQWMVNTILANIESKYNISLCRSLEYFFDYRTMLAGQPVLQLRALAEIVVSSSDYVAFHNALFNHDCSTVESLLNRGYSLDYVSRLYSNQALATVKTIWPDYEDWMDDYWRENRAW